jgi:hypothetical protein
VRGLVDVDGPNANSATRIPVGRRLFSLPTLALLYISFIVALLSFVFVLKQPQELGGWLVTGVAIVSAWALIYRNLHHQRDWDGITYIQLQDETIAYIPSRMMRRQGCAVASAPFPAGSGLECHIATGDRYFTGDRGQMLLKSLWVVQPDGTRHNLLSDVIDLNLRTMLTNLHNRGTSFRVIKLYDGQAGEHSETDITDQYIRPSRQRRTPILLGTSGLWLGVLASVLSHSAVYVSGIGVLGFTTMAVFSLHSETSRRSALVHVVTLIPSYAAGYAFAVVAVWYIFKR